MNDPRMKKLLDYARVRERQMYQTAESRVRITVILTCIQIFFVMEINNEKLLIRFSLHSLCEDLKKSLYSSKTDQHVGTSNSFSFRVNY